MLMQIKQQNNGSFKNLTVKDITERVSELKGIYYLYKIHTCLHQGMSKVWYQGILKATVSGVFEDLKFKISEGSDQN